MRYALLHNLDKYSRSADNADNVWGEYRPEHRLATYYEGEIAEPPDGDLVATAWTLFQRHNRDDRPCGQMGPSLSVGDVIVFHPDGEPARALTMRHAVREPWVEVEDLDRLVMFPGSYLAAIGRGEVRA